VHDLLGYCLSTITLKCELTRRILASQPDRADRELTEIFQVARQALTEMRIVTSGSGQLTLATELEAAAATLAAAGIDVSVSASPQPVPQITETVLATATREAVTNLLRHSSASQCLIQTSHADGQVLLRIANDGAARRRPPAYPPGGHGLVNLAYRAQVLGGQVQAGVRPDGWFELTAALPVPAGDASGPQATGSAEEEPQATGSAQEEGPQATGSAEEEGEKLIPRS
jgi:two-component system sensor histidine kinase DesK